MLGELYISRFTVGNIAAKTLTKPPFDKVFMQVFSDGFLNKFPICGWVTDTEVGLQGAENCAFKLALSSKVKTNDDHRARPEL